MNRYELQKQGEQDLARVKSEIERRPPLFERMVSAVLPSRGAAMMKARISAQYYRYEAAQVTGLRSWHGTLQLPPESLATKSDRTNMVMAGREMVENDPIFNGILRKLEVYIAGSLRYQADTGDDELDRAVNKYFNEEFWYDCEVSGRYCFQDIVRLAIREQSTVGDCGLVWVNDLDGELRLMFIEGDRIGHPYKTLNQKNYLNGIFVNPLGRPTFYEVYQRDTQSASYNNPQQIPASEFIHYFETTRADTYRGIPSLHAVQNALTDLREFQESMRFKVKSSAAETFFITTETGLPSPQDVLNSTVPNATSTTPGQVIQTSFGKMRFGTPNEKITETESTYPAAQIQAYYETVLMTIANSQNLSYGLIRDMASLKGSGVRAVLAQDDREFGLRRKNLDARLLRPVKNRAILNAALRRYIPGANPRDERLYKGIFHFPGKLTIDVGRDGSNNVMLNNNALLTAQEIYGDEGGDWREGIDQCVREASYLQEKCTAAGVEIADVRRIQSGIVGGVKPAPGEGDDPENAAPPAKDAPKKKKAKAKK